MRFASLGAQINPQMCIFFFLIALKEKKNGGRKKKPTLRVNIVTLGHRTYNKAELGMPSILYCSY